MEQNVNTFKIPTTWLLTMFANQDHTSLDVSTRYSRVPWLVWFGISTVWNEETRIERIEARNENRKPLKGSGSGWNGGRCSKCKKIFGSQLFEYRLHFDTFANTFPHSQHLFDTLIHLWHILTRIFNLLFWQLVFNYKFLVLVSNTSWIKCLRIVDNVDWVGDRGLKSARFRVWCDDES